MVQWSKKNERARDALSRKDSSDQVKCLARPAAKGLTFLQLIQGRDLLHAIDGEDEADALW